jgi:hypothetical protein
MRFARQQLVDLDSCQGTSNILRFAIQPLHQERLYLNPLIQLVSEHAQNLELRACEVKKKFSFL